MVRLFNHTIDDTPLIAPAGKTPPKDHKELMKRYHDAHDRSDTRIIRTPFTGMTMEDMQGTGRVAIQSAINLIELEAQGMLPVKIGTIQPNRRSTPALAMTDIRMASLGAQSPGWQSLKTVLTKAARRR